MKTCSLLPALLFIVNFVFAQGEISGTVTDDQNEPVWNAYVTLKINDSQKRAVTNEDGYFSFKPLDPGTYSLEVSYVGAKKYLIPNITLSTGQTRNFDIQMEPKLLMGHDDIVIRPPTSSKEIIEPGYPGDIAVITAKSIKNYAVGQDFADIVSTTGKGIYQEDSGAPLHFQGARSNATLYIIDGVKIIGDPALPKNAIEDMVVYTGGIPAKYGDTIGGVIVITTKSYKFF